MLDKISIVYTNCRGLGTINRDTKECEPKEFRTTRTEVKSLFHQLYANSSSLNRYFCASMHHRLSSLFAMRRTKVQIKTRPSSSYSNFCLFPFFSLLPFTINNESSKKFTELKPKIMYVMLFIGREVLWNADPIG